MRIGLVGLPNAGRSTLFNAVTGLSVPVAPFPYTTIESATGIASVPDQRLESLARLAESKKVVPASIELVDIAGLAPGASAGEGLGNSFLTALREIDALCHVVRCFDREDVPHVHGVVDPAADIDAVNTELILKDFETVERRAERATRAARGGDSGLRADATVLADLAAHLGGGAAARSFAPLADRPELATELALLTAKPVVYAANIGEDDLGRDTDAIAAVRAAAERDGAEVVVVSADVEAQVAQLDTADRPEFLASLGLEHSGLDRLVAAAYRLLDLVTFYTAGPKESRAWPVRTGSRAPRAAREIHSDLERGFIRAEVIAYDDWLRHGSEQAAKDAGVMRVEGKEYVVRDGDVLHIRFNV